MSTSNNVGEAFVWIWLPDELLPVVAGRLEADNDNLLFNYAQSYLERVGKGSKAAIAIYEPELPLQAGVIPLLAGLVMPSCIRDAAPDAWGRRVILNMMLGRKGASANTAELDELSYLLESSSDRIGALYFLRSPSAYESRATPSGSLESLTELIESADRVERGIPLSLELDKALVHGSSSGGAQPKALIQRALARTVERN